NLGFDFNFYPGQDFYTANGPHSPTANNIVPASNNTIRGNAIYHNAGPSIDLDPTGVLPNAPVITVATGLGNSSYIAGTLDSTPDTLFTIDFYSDAGDHSTVQAYLGSTTVPTDSTGHATFNFSVLTNTIG